MHPVRPRLRTTVFGVRPRPTRPYLMKRFHDIRFDADPQPAVGPLPLKHLGAGLMCMAIGAEGPPAVRLQPHQPGPRPLQSRPPLGAVLVALLRAVIPQDPVPDGAVARLGTVHWRHGSG